MANTYNLFISHSWSYSDAYEKITNLLAQRPYFFYRDYSVPKNDPIHTRGSERELFAAIKRRIQPCHAILMLAGVYSSYSRWIQQEILIANNEFSVRKPIIAIEPWASEKTSQIVKENADRIVRWNSNSIVSAIREVSN